MEYIITKDRILDELCSVAFSDYTEFVQAVQDDEGNTVIDVAPSNKLTDRQRSAVCMIKAGTRGAEVKLYDKLKALEMLARLSGAFESTDDELEELRRIMQIDEEDELE